MHLIGLILQKALEADPKATVAEAQKWAGLSGQRAWNASEDVYIQVKERVQKYIKQGRLGIFGNAYWGSEGFKLTPEQNLIGLSHYLDALELQRDLAKMMAIFGGKNPHPQSFVVGGVTCVQDIKILQELLNLNNFLKEEESLLKRLIYQMFIWLEQCMVKRH